ncbi:unnamed protein product [Phaedon cochleariae]|uniref:Alpha-galactosidase n=1 Tax=Phaedon cochleariae TaxID=80249 RepID=A0A9P0DLC0_PHACE|nr:unnamed protein product [Phaedon cochleariae]
MTPSAYLAVLLAIASPTIIQALDNGLARTPPMGWMHWQRFRCLIDCQAYPDECISERLFRTMAERLATDGYLQAGYEYIMIDDCWASKERDSDGKLQPDPDRFPNGIKPLADYVHSLGLKFGIYGDYGILTCGGYPGSKYHLEVDANTFAEWGVDYLKLDGCYTDFHNIEEGYVEMGKYLNATGRPITYSCSWPAYQEPEGLKSNYTKLAETCNLWRNWDDIEDSWDNVTDIVDWFSGNQDRIANFSGPGHWNDPDMLLIGNYGLSYEQSKAQMAVWAVMAAPLIMSVDLRTIEPQMKNILLNAEAIRVNQDPLGIMGRLVLKKEKIDIWTKPVLPIVKGTNSYAVALMSRRVDGYPRRINVTLSELNITHPGGFILKDIFSPQNEPVAHKDKDVIFIRVPPTGGLLLLATPR